MDELGAFARLVETIRPWAGHLVIVGGWAHRLHRVHDRAHPPAYAALRTKDADLAFSPSSPIEGDIAAALKAAGFHEVPSLEHTPPVTQYHLGDDGGGFYAEFLVPLHGSGVKRSGQPDATMAKAGVSAQKVRYLDLLLVEPWVVRLSAEVGFPVRAPLDVLIPNPVSFIAQKLLIRKYRVPGKKAQDALYIHDTLELFGDGLPLLRALWHGRVRATLPERTAKAVERLYREQFGEVDDVIRSAVRIPPGRALRPERFQAACLYGLEEIFRRAPESAGTTP